MIKKFLSVFLTVAIVFATVPASILTTELYAGEPDPNTPEGQYEILTGRMEAAKRAIEAAAEDSAIIDFGNGYVLDTQHAMLDFADKIDIDLGVAAALVDGVYNDPRFAPVQNSNTSAGYNQTNFNSLISRSGGNFQAAVRYLTQGGIREGQRSTGINPAVQWFFSFKSKLNPGYTASATSGLLGGISENGVLPSGTTLADIAENYAYDLIIAASLLSDEIDRIKDYAAQATPDNLIEYLQEQACIEEGCEDGYCPDGTCPDWTSRLMVDEYEWLEAIDAFQANIKRDIDIISQLATGSITGYWSENKNGYNYYNNTFAADAVAKIIAALDYIQNGGFTCGIPGGAFFVDTGDWLWYKSNFTGYKVEHNSGLAGGSFSVEGEDEIIPLMEVHLDILKMGATPSALETVYNFKINSINEYIDQASLLRGSYVPAGGAYSQEEYDAAIEAFIAGAWRDIAIADALYSGDFSYEVVEYASKWEGFGTSPEDFYLHGFDYLIGSTAGPGDTEEKRLFNAISFLNTGGYGNGFSLDLSWVPLLNLGRIGLEIEFKSSFHPDYSSGLFGIAVNKVNTINVLKDTFLDMSAGNPYLSPLAKAKQRYAEAKTQLEAVKADPSAIVATLLENDEELGRLLSDLDILIGSLDDIVNIIDLIGSLGLDSGIIDSLLQPLGINYETLQGLAGLREMLNGIGIDTSGNQTIEDALAPSIAPILGAAIDIAIGAADVAALLGTVEAYNIAAEMIEGVYNLLNESALDAINLILGPVMELIEPIRPYFDMLSSGISLVNNALTLFDQVGTLTSDFNLGNLSDTTYTLAYTLDDLADLLVAFEATDIGGLLSGVLGGLDVGGAVSGGLAGLLNGIVNGAIGSDVLDLSGDNLGFLSDLANTLLDNGLNNPTALVPLLRASATILRNVAAVENGLDDLFSGNYQTILSALVGMFTGEDNIITGVVGMWNAIFDLFRGTSGSVPEEIQAAADIMPVMFQMALFAEVEETSAVLSNPAVGESHKRAKLNEFINYMFCVREYIKEMREMIHRMEDACDWAKANLTEENAKVFIEAFARHYANELMACVKDGVRASRLPHVVAEIKALSREAADILRYIKCEGALTIIATPVIGEDDAHYVFSTNYDDLRAKIDQFLSCLRITDGFEIISDSSDGGFYLEGNTLRSVPGFFAGHEPGDASFNIKVAYVLNFGCLGHDRPSILATKLVNVNMEIGPGKDVLYTVTFDANGGMISGPGQITVKEGDEITLPAASRDGFSFDGWYDGVLLAGNAYDEYQVNKDVTLIARWTGEPEVTLVNATPTAYVDKLNGNQNRLYITVIELYSDGTSKTVEWNGLINNNAAGTYQVGGYRVYVDTKGNTQIRECYIVK